MISNILQTITFIVCLVVLGISTYTIVILIRGMKK